MIKRYRGFPLKVVIGFSNTRVRVLFLWYHFFANLVLAPVLILIVAPSFLTLELFIAILCFVKTVFQVGKLDLELLIH